jgi:two-component system cell cycle sensor histidine kinase/response regulator CckA
MDGRRVKLTAVTESMFFASIGIAMIYWVCESFMYFFLAPEANFIHHILGPNLFETWTRVLVLCLFVLFGSHSQYMLNKLRAAYKELQQSEHKYRTILESIEEGYFEVDLNGNLAFFNGPLAKILERSPAELQSSCLRDYTTAETARTLDRTFEEIKQTVEPVHVTDFEAMTPTGDQRKLELSASLIQDQYERAVGFRGVLRDVTERKKAEEEKRQLETQLLMIQKMESIGTLAGGIAHDFNNILMGIQGNASLMQLKIDSDHPSYQKIKNIENYVASGTELTRQLLGFARRGKYAVKATDLNDIIEKSSRMFGRTKKEIQIHTNLAEDLGTVEIDRGQLDQVLLNLYVNAWQAMPEGGDLYLKTENAILDENYVKPYKVVPGKYVKVTVTDTGVGIKKEHLGRIFEPFFTTKEMGRGTGLGLASVYGVIKNHGGYINVYSEKKLGTTFSFYLPASDKEAVQEREKPVQAAKGTETILLIDDEAMILDVGQELLGELGYTVITANGGEEALRIFEKHRDKIQLVIMDMIMPVMSGGETFDRLKALSPDIKILLSSGYSLNGQATKILERGCDGFIQKPFNMNQLSQKIREILDNRRGDKLRSEG